MAEWEAYYRLEPFGEYQEYWRTGLICSMIANALRGKDSPVKKPEDFIPDYIKGIYNEVATKKQSKQKMKEVLTSVFGSGQRKLHKRDLIRARKKALERGKNMGCGKKKKKRK